MKYKVRPRYTHSFQGQLHDDEISYKGGIINYKYRQHSTLYSRFWSPDPLFRDYPWNSPYAFSENRVIDMIELEGLESADPSEMSVYGKAKLTTGKLGLKVVWWGVEFEMSYAFEGGGSTGVEGSAGVGNDNSDKADVHHVQSVQEEGGWTFKAGVYGGEESTTKETRRGVDDDRGFYKEEETVKKDEVTVGPVTVDKEGNTSAKAAWGFEVNALLIGVGAEAGVEMKEKETPKK